MMKVTGGPIIYARAGSAVTLECSVSGLAAAPAVLRWTRSGEDDLSASVSPRTRDGVSLDTERAAGTSRVSLYLRRAQLTDTGNYTCAADRVSRTVLVVVTGPGSATPLHAPPPHSEQRQCCLPSPSHYSDPRNNTPALLMALTS